MSRRMVLGTAGHIDHGKSALVRALTGVDPDRLEEEKRRGITIDLGFAELTDGRRRMGVVDVPGHEDFVRTMVAGATGVDAVLLVVAADEGVMPQTREHLQIVSLLEVERLVVALTKADLVEDPEWMALVRDDVRELLAGTAWPDAALIPTSVESGDGLETLARTLLDLAEAAAADARAEDDLARLPLDRAFTVRGTGTVVTGTLASGVLGNGGRVRILPEGPEARIRGLQVHGRDVEEARAGERTAVALAGVDRDALHRGQALLAGDGWRASERLTARLRILPDTGWEIVHNQRVRVHLGTAEVMARAVLLDSDVLGPGAEGWVQLRLEQPLVARTGDRLVIRSYSPMTTIGGGVVAEPLPPRRRRLEPATEEALGRLLGDADEARVGAALDLASWAGASVAELPVATGLTPAGVRAALARLTDAGARVVEDVALAAGRVAEARRLLLEAVDAHHASEPLRPGVDAEAFRRALPGGSPAALADALLAELVSEGALVADHGIVARPGFRPMLTPEQEGARTLLEDVYRDAGLAPPSVDELPEGLSAREDLWPILRLLESSGALVALEDGVFAWRESVDAVAREVVRRLGGAHDLGPADFKDVIPVSRKHLLPLLALLDRRGVTVRRGGGRDVAEPPSDEHGGTGHAELRSGGSA